MASNWTKHLGYLGAVIVVLFMCLAVLFVVFGVQVETYLIARKITRQKPSMSFVPTPLTDSTPTASSGTKISRFGYELEAPWSDVDRIDDRGGIARVVFKSGRVLVLFNPIDAVDRIHEMQKAAQGTGKPSADIRKVFGSQATSSNFDLVRTVLSTKPEDAKLSISREDAIKLAILLVLKNSEISNAVGGVFSIQTPALRGFQKGDPEGGARMVVLDLFDVRDHEFVIWFAAEPSSGVRITQGDINRIVQTLHPAPPSN